MRFAAPIPLWLVTLLVAAIVGIAYFSYRRPLVPLSIGQRSALVALRAAVLIALLLVLCRPILFVPARQADAVVPILVDTSRSMRVADAERLTRMARATQLLKDELLPELSRRFAPELYGVAESVTPLAPGMLDQIEPGGRRSDLTSALTAIRDKYRGRRISGIVLLSDGGDTSSSEQTAGVQPAGGPPIFVLGVGQADGLRDREILEVTAGDPRLDQASVDLQVSAVSHGFGREPYELQVRANGQLIESRRVTPVADGSPVDATFTVLPDAVTPTVFAVEVAAGADEGIRENNSRALIVSPPGRRRKILALAGAPGFEHSFMIRVLSQDPGLEVDSVVRKGKNDSGRDTFLVQSSGNRASLLAQGLPSRKEDLFAYDAIIIANVEGDFFTRAQLAMMADFVSERGGGLLVLGGRSFSQRGLMGTPLEAVLPVELDDRRGGLARSSLGADLLSAPQNVLVVTPEGARHPVMRIGSTAEDTRNRWAALPPLAASAALGGPRPGASVLAVAAAPAGIYPVVAVQRFGRGRSMVFGGEAAWRWRMMRPSTDRTFEFFWRQSARWLAGPAPDPVSITVPELAEPGDSIAIEFDVRNAAFAPVGDAAVVATITTPGGATQALTPHRDASENGTLMSTVALQEPGLYRVRAEARRGTEALGAADRWFYVGGSDREFADPRLNEGVLRRIARASGGRYASASDASQVLPWLGAAIPQSAAPERRDVWHQPWVYAVVIALLSAEWVLRRRWGLR